MKSLKSVFARTLLAAFFGLVSFAGVANAQSIRFSGHIALPVAVRWGTANLPAGDYSLKLESTKSTPMLLVITDAQDKNVAFVVPLTGGYDENLQGEDCIMLDRTSESSAVRELRIPSAGIDLVYGSSRRSKKGIEEAQTRVTQINMASASK